MSDFANALAELLARVQRPGGFHVTGSFDIHPPRLEVDGVGPIALPLLPAQAEQIIQVAEQAPYGRGPETLVDTGVRRTWQVDAARVHIGGRRWEEDLAAVVQRVRLGLAVADQVQARPVQALGLRHRQLLRRPPRHGEGARDVRDPGHSPALRLQRWRACDPPQGPGGAGGSAPGRALGGRLRGLLRGLPPRGPAHRLRPPPGPGLQPAAGGEGARTRRRRTTPRSRGSWPTSCAAGPGPTRDRPS